MTTAMDRTERGTDDSVLGRVRALLPDIAARAADGEVARAVPPEIVAGLRAAGVFRMALPKVWGGEQLGLLHSAEVVREVAEADGSTGWTVQVASMAWTFLRGLPRKTLQERGVRRWRRPHAPRRRRTEGPGDSRRGRLPHHRPLATGQRPVHAGLDDRRFHDRGCGPIAGRPAGHPGCTDPSRSGLVPRHVEGGGPAGNTKQ